MYTTCKMKETTSNCYKTTKDKSELMKRESESARRGIGIPISYGDKKWPRDFVISPENYRHTSRVPLSRREGYGYRLPEHHRTPLASWTLPTSLTVWLATESTQKAKSAESRPRYLERGARRRHLFLTLRLCWNKINK